MPLGRLAQAVRFALSRKEITLSDEIISDADSHQQIVHVSGEVDFSGEDKWQNLAMSILQGVKEENGTFEVECYTQLDEKTRGGFTITGRYRKVPDGYHFEVLTPETARNSFIVLKPFQPAD